MSDYLSDPHLTPGVKEFLKTVNAPGLKPIESLSIDCARQVLVDAQNSVQVDYLGIEETVKTIQTEDHTLNVNLVRPEGINKRCPLFSSSTEGAGSWETNQPIRSKGRKP